MPLEMPESVLVRFRAASSAGITLRDVVNSIPIRDQAGLLTVPAKNKVNVFNGRILEIEGSPISGGTGLRALRRLGRALAAACTIDPDPAPVIEF